MSLYETRDCGHSEIVLAKKCRTCEYIAKEKELKDLRWFRDQINSNVIPGEMDSADSAYDLIQRLRAALEQIEQDTRNSSVVGHPGITCMECEDTNKRARKALGR